MDDRTLLRATGIIGSVLLLVAFGGLLVGGTVPFVYRAWLVGIGGGLAAVVLVRYNWRRVRPVVETFSRWSSGQRAAAAVLVAAGAGLLSQLFARYLLPTGITGASSSVIAGTAAFYVVLSAVEFATGDAS